MQKIKTLPTLQLLVYQRNVRDGCRIQTRGAHETDH